MYAGANDELLKSFVEQVAARTDQEVTWVPELCSYQLSTKSWGALAVKMHHYFFVARNEDATAADFDAFTKACVSWGLNHYKGLPRGVQKGVAIYPVLLQTNPSAEVVAYTKQKPNAHWAAFALPVVANLSTRSIEYLDKTPVWGFAIWKGIKKTATEALSEPLRSLRIASGGTQVSAQPAAQSDLPPMQKYGRPPMP